MKRIIATLALGGFMSYGSHAMADQPPPESAPPPPPQTQAQVDQNKAFMKDCMAKAKAANDGTSVKDMRKACRAQLKASMGNPGEPVVPGH